MEKINAVIYGLSILLSTLNVQANDFKEAELVTTVLPKFEVYTNRPDRFVGSGMIELVFMVDKTGKATEIEIVRSSLPRYEGQALAAISKYKYQPATLNSKPVESRQMARIEFDTSRLSNRARPMLPPRGYMSHYNRLSRELDKEEPREREIERLLRKLRFIRFRTFFSSVHTELAQNRYATKFGSKEKQLEPLLNIMMYEDVEWRGKLALDASTKSTIQLSILKLLLDLGYYAEALEKYNEYSTGNVEVIGAFSGSIEKIKQVQLSEYVVERRVDIDSRGYSFLPLLKRSFVINATVGQLHTFELRCDTNYASFEFKQDVQYHIPASWRRCELQMNGEPDSTISILQQ